MRTGYKIDTDNDLDSVENYKYMTKGLSFDLRVSLRSVCRDDDSLLHNEHNEWARADCGGLCVYISEVPFGFG